MCRIAGGSGESWEIGGVVDVMDLAKLAIEAARKEGHLEDILGEGALSTPGLAGAFTATVPSQRLIVSIRIG